VHVRTLVWRKTDNLSEEGTCRAIKTGNLFDDGACREIGFLTRKSAIKTSTPKVSKALWILKALTLFKRLLIPKALWVSTYKRGSR
jgi:hypothetical protein